MISYYMLFGSISMIDNYYKVSINLMKELICEGRCAVPGTVTGVARVIIEPNDIINIKDMTTGN